MPGRLTALQLQLVRGGKTRESIAFKNALFRASVNKGIGMGVGNTYRMGT